jgi:hypothetical protein
MELREQVARLIAEKHTNLHPDTPIIPHELPRLINGGYIAPDPKVIAPLWMFYLAAADAAIALMKAQPH